MMEEEDILRAMTVSVRALQDPLSFVEPLRRQVAALDVALAVSDVQTMEARMAAAKAPQRLSTILMVAFAVAALLMAAVGIYGILAYNVAQRVREIGVRLALGAEQGQVMRLVALQGMVLAALGLVVGMPCAFALTRFMSTLLYQTNACDPVTMAGVPIVLGTITLVACYLPARRTSRIDPIQALRTE